MNPTPLPDAERVEKLATDILLVIRANYIRGPIDRDRVYEALNALAYVLALTIQGVDDDQSALVFFEAAFRKNRNPMNPPK